MGGKELVGAKCYLARKNLRKFAEDNSKLTIYL
jgi:hypothetical protein